MKQSPSYFLVILLIFCAVLELEAQRLERFYPAFVENGQTLAEATVGGLSAPQFSEIDLNNDGMKDLYIYDKIGGLGLTYLNGGTPNQVDYTYAPEYEANFPPLFEWVILRDYNGDGIEDIFSYSSTPGIPGIEVYTGFYNSDNRIAFRQNQLTGGQFNIIYYPGNSGNNNLYVSSIDYPAIDDIDGDGDLDIITFNVAGGIVEYYQNQSVEQGFQKDSLIYILADRCWGRFFESGLGKELDLSTDPNECVLNLQAAEPRSGLHAGSTILTIDLDDDGDKEVILGDISFNNLNLATNGGTPEQAFMTDQDTAFPSNDVSVELPLFPAAFSLDVDNDGIKDLLAAPNLGNDIGETYEVAWFYKNVGTNEVPVYELQQKDLFTEKMIDYGTGAQPVFVDYNQDGLLDLVVGNKSFYMEAGMRNARIFLYENVGTANEPVFELKNDDLFGLNRFSQNAWRFTPTFGDLDGDGDLDALIGEEFGNLFYAENIAGEGQPFQFSPAIFGYQDIDVGQSNRPQIVDMNGDDLPDLVIGERNGNLNYFENTGTVTNPIFSEDPTNNFFGRVDARAPNQVTGYSVPVVLEMDGEIELFVGNEVGQIKRYTNIENNLAGAFVETETDYGQIRTGAEMHPAFADLNGDGRLEIAIGNVRGGLVFFRTDLKSQITSSPEVKSQFSFQVAPNPTFDKLTFSWEGTKPPERLLIYHSNGQILVNQPFETEVEIGHLANGIYVLEVLTESGRFTKKIVKQ
ncbi:MAG: T9SS type A sorting domain-containing protein [Bacteroidota bacterium]